METQQNSSRREVIRGCLNQLGLEISALLSSEEEARETVEGLTSTLKAFEAAYVSLESDRKTLEEALEKLKQEIEQERHELKTHLRGFRVVCLIDGDGCIFSDDLIADGRAGGKSAAKMLSEATANHLWSNFSINQYQLWVYVFFHKRGLSQAFRKAQLSSVQTGLDEFVMGFNNASDKFLMVDVGDGKEAADAKIRAYLDDNIRLPQTLKVIFGGCHDNGYVPILRSLMTAGFEDKLILLRGYSKMTPDIEELELPSFTVPDLFRPDKLVTSQSVPGTPRCISNNKPLDASPTTSPKAINKSLSSMRRLSNVSNHSSILQLESTSTVEFSTSEPNRGALTDMSLSSNPGPSSQGLEGQHVDPNTLSKHQPPPCKLFYLAHCKYGAYCRFGHNYILEVGRLEDMRINAKMTPCSSAKKDKICSYGKNCIYGHVCPFGPKCARFEKGQCKFNGSGMHN